MDALRGLATSSPTDQVERINAFDAYERGLIAHVRGSMEAAAATPRPAQPKPLRLSVAPYEGKEGENLHFWVREVEIAMQAGLLSDEPLRVAFALSKLGGRAKTWAMTMETTSPGCFTSYTQLVEQLRAAFLPANIEYRQRSRFLACKQGRRELHEYVQEMRVLAASLVGNPLTEDVKVTVFMEGLRVGPARTQLFRAHANTLEAAIQTALQEEYSHKQARTPVTAWQPPANNGPVPMDLGTAEQSDIRCFACGKLGHMQRVCPAGGQGRRTFPRPVSRTQGPRGRWQRPRPRGQGNAGHQ